MTRIWRGHVAASFDLVGALRSGFNGELSSKLLAVVDEVREGARADQWEHSETLKQMVTAERRTINNKYGALAVEFNCCRFLLFSNSPAAIPLGKNDRRFEVTIFEGDPRPERDYGKLYGLLGNPDFINDVAVWLGRRDITGFNPGARARHSAGKERIVQATQSEGNVYAQAIVDHWPCDVIGNNVLSEVVDPRAGSAVTALVRATAAEAGMRPRSKPVWTGSANARVHIIRNHERWLEADGAAVASEMRRGVPASIGLNHSWRDWLDGIAGREGTFG